jgi:hypothetical protein
MHMVGVSKYSNLWHKKYQCQCSCSALCVSMSVGVSSQTDGSGGVTKLIETLGSFTVATYLILIFYLIGFYCEIIISSLINRNIWHL